MYCQVKKVFRLFRLALVFMRIAQNLVTNAKLGAPAQTYGVSIYTVCKIFQRPLRIRKQFFRIASRH